MPRLQKPQAMFDHLRAKSIQLMGAESMRLCKCDGFKPEFCDVVSTFNVDVNRL
jgi:hypothetical protein